MTTPPTTVARASASKVPNPPLKSHSTALVSSSASLTGNYPITLSANVIIQLRAHLSSTLGPINIGENSIISEHAFIGSPTSNQPQTNPDGKPITGISLASGVLVEVGASIEAASIGDFTVIEAGARIGKGAVTGKNCKICAKVEVGEGEVVGDNVVIYGSGWGERRVERVGSVMDVKKEKWVKEQGAALRRVWTGK